MSAVVTGLPCVLDGESYEAGVEVPKVEFLVASEAELRAIVYPCGVWPIAPGGCGRRSDKIAHWAFLELGTRWGWWSDWTSEGPLPNPFTVKAADYAGKSMAHVMADAGAFASVAEARRNGWGRPVERGSFRVGKRRPEIQVV